VTYHAEPLDALQIVCRDRDEWKARAEKAERERDCERAIALQAEENYLLAHRRGERVESETIARVCEWLSVKGAGQYATSECVYIAQAIERGEWKEKGE
jgi:hypothetical protein